MSGRVVVLARAITVRRLQALRVQNGRSYEGSKIISGDGRQQVSSINTWSNYSSSASPGGRRSWEWQGLAGLGELAWLFCATHCFVEYVAEPYTVAGPSMEPTIRHMSLVAINKMRGRSGSLKLGDIVVAQSPPEPGRMVVKRVVGLPGDFIKVRPPPWDVHNTLQIEKRLEVVPEGHVWLEGDNRDNSTDSRSYGAVPQALVEGVVFLRIWPLRDVGLM